MRKELIKLGDKLAWDGQTANVGVIVVDLGGIGTGNQVGIMDGGITHIVDACHLAPMPKPVMEKTSPTIKADEETVVIGEPIPNTIPTIELRYDKAIHSLFIIINDKSTICVPNVSENLLNEVGISHKHDSDTYNQSLGNSLAYYRSMCRREKSKCQGSPFDFLDELFGQKK